MNRRILYIIIHCTATPEGREVSVSEIDNWHRNKPFFFKMIGYHYVVYLDGSVHQGRPLEMVGAHCAGYNKSSIGVYYVGGYAKDCKTAKDTRTPEQKKALRELLMKLKKMYPEASIVGHHDFNPGKPCPCFDAKKEYSNL